MSERPKVGDRVEWNTPQGKTRGKVERRLTKSTQVKGHKVAASPQEPEYLVRSDKSGKTAAHRSESLSRR